MTKIQKKAVTDALHLPGDVVGDGKAEAAIHVLLSVANLPLTKRQAFLKEHRSETLALVESLTAMMKDKTVKAYDLVFPAKTFKTEDMERIQVALRKHLDSGYTNVNIYVKGNTLQLRGEVTEKEEKSLLSYLGSLDGVKVQSIVPPTPPTGRLDEFPG